MKAWRRLLQEELPIFAAGLWRCTLTDSDELRAIRQEVMTVAGCEALTILQRRWEELKTNPDAVQLLLEGAKNLHKEVASALKRAGIFDSFLGQVSSLDVALVPMFSDMFRLNTELAAVEVKMDQMEKILSGMEPAHVIGASLELLLLFLKQGLETFNEGVPALAAETVREFDIGSRLFSSSSQSPDRLKGFAALQKAAQHGHPQAQFLVATEYMRGTHVPRDQEQALIEIRII